MIRTATRGEYLTISIPDEICQGGQRLAGVAEPSDRFARLLDELGGAGAPGLDAQQLRVGRFAAVGVFGGPLADVRLRTRHVEQVVGDLKCEAKFLAIFGEGRELFPRGTSHDPAEFE